MKRNQLNILNKYLVIILLTSVHLTAQNIDGFQIARLKYNGGGDWYNDPSAEVNLLKFVKDKTNIEVNPEYVFVDITSNDLFSYPFLFLTGHGNIVFSDSEAGKLRTYLENGGFLFVDDDYGLDKSFRREIKKVFPNKDIVELPFNHKLYHCFYNFEYGPPKVHEHDDKPPKGFGIFVKERLAVYYTFESNPSDGWTDQRVHNNSQAKREEALKFGTNLVIWVLSN